MIREALTLIFWTALFLAAPYLLGAYVGLFGLGFRSMVGMG